MAKQIDMNQVRDLPDAIKQLEESIGAPIPNADINALFTEKGK